IRDGHVTGVQTCALPISEPEGGLRFVKSKTFSLARHAMYNEKWLQEQLAEDPSLLGLGDLEVKDIERRQPHAGRLDMLLSDPERSEERRVGKECRARR